MSLWKINKIRGLFPSDEALLKLFYLAIQNISKKWTMPILKTGKLRSIVLLSCSRNGCRSVYESRLHKIQDAFYQHTEPLKFALAYSMKIQVK